MKVMHVIGRLLSDPENDGGVCEALRDMKRKATKFFEFGSETTAERSDRGNGGRALIGT